MYDVLIINYVQSSFTFLSFNKKKKKKIEKTKNIEEYLLVLIRWPGIV